MSSRWIEGLRSVELEVADLTKAEAFYTQTWRLQVADRRSGAIYLRGSGQDAFLLALHQGDRQARLRNVTLRARSEASLHDMANAVLEAGGAVLQAPGPMAEDPAGGVGFVFADPHGRCFKVVHGDARRGVAADDGDGPVRLAHVVLNSSTNAESRAFLERALDFRLIDLTAAIAFMNCNGDHHSIGLAISDNDALNHIAFLMPDGEALMRGAGRLRDDGFPIEWGPGRHGPGNNLFSYFVDPFGVAIEYTAEVQQVDERYKPRGPAEWRWPPGRVDQWGISAMPSMALKESQKLVHFAPLSLGPRGPLR